MSLAELFSVYQNNVFPAMLDILSEDLGVKRSSLQALGVGYYPGWKSWVFAERDAKGDIVGLKYRGHKGKKHYEKGSTSGLSYQLNTNSVRRSDRYAPGRAKWTRIADANVLCPVCGKPDWCRVSPDDPANPSAVLCSRIQKGCTKVISEHNYLHILDPDRNKEITGRTDVLPETSLPILIVEGATDVLAAMDLGFVAIGRPSATGGLTDLSKMPLTGRQVWIVGENDAGAGKEGLDRCFATLHTDVRDLVRIMPPEGVKDLRQWVGQGLTQEDFIKYVEQNGNCSTALDPSILEDDAAYNIAEGFLNAEYTTDGVFVLRNLKGQWLTWDGSCYVDHPENILRGSLYRYLADKQFIKPSATGPTIVPYKATACKVHDILDALSAWCPVTTNPPVWLSESDIEPKDVIAFHNGLLDVSEYMGGSIVLHEPDPSFFSLCVFPYDFNPDAKSDLWIESLDDIFNEDEELIQLLQEWFGYVCTMDMSMEKLMLFTGRSRSGKGTVLEAMTAMLGRNQCISTNFQTLASQFGLVPLMGKLAATLGDAKTPKAREADAALETILRIVGQDPIHIRPLYRQGFDAYLTARFTVAMNGLPTFTDYAKALTARTNIISFPNTYVGREDFTLKSRLKQEAEQGKLIPWALEGLRRLRERGKFEIPKQSALDLEDMVNITSPISAFVDACCELEGVTTAANPQMVFEVWQRWCADNGHRPGVLSQFGRNLMAECPTVTKGRKRVGKQREYTYEGLTLQQWVYEKYLGRPE